MGGPVTKQATPMTMDDWRAECANASTAELLEVNMRYVDGQFDDFGWAHNPEIAEILQSELQRRAALIAGDASTDQGWRHG